MEQDFGVCRLSVVPVRKELGSAIQSYQLLFGDSYQVIDRSKDKLWLSVKTNFDGIEGWIHRNHHHSITQEYFDQINQADFKITLDLVSTLLYKKSPLPILLGSIVPISSAELFKMDEQFAFNGETKSISQKRDAEFIKSVAMKYLNAPEVEGGKNPFGICAQGLSNMVFKIAGHPLPWGVHPQSQAGKKVKDINSAKAGDLAFFKDKKGNINHVGIILGENKIIHAYGHVRIDHLNEEGILNAETKIYSHSLATIRRLLS
ncbi:MAG: C40 family peptidase [Bacteroidetes bacterium]|nr:C40 family peptidase [Bacteroidota bacterium]MBI3482570.1 C40 family peptidase [Bacteroidota bacterium]